MRRGIRGKSKNSYFSSASGGRPPGLKGKDIGLYFRDLGRKQNLITLRVPETVVAALHDNIKSIEEVASKEGIYLEPVKELRFVKPNTDGADFIPLQVNEYEKESHHVTNIIRKDNDIIFVSKTKVDVGYEDDVIYVRTGRAEPVFISDDEATASSYDSKISMEIDMKPTAHKKARADVAFIHNIDTAGESDMKPYYNLDEENVSSTDIDLDSITYNKNKAKIEPVAGSSSTNDVILLDNSNKDIKTSKSDIKPIWILDNGTEADSDLMPDKKFEDVGSSTKLNDAMLLDDSNENIKCDIKPISKQERDNISSECSNAKSMADQKIDSQTEPKILFKPVAGSSTKLNDVVLLDDYDEDVILVASTYRDNETHSSRKDYKYGYEDIITGKFEDTLDKSLAKGIEINIKSETTSKLNEALLEEFNIMQQKPKYKEMREFRKTLPTYKMAEELLDVVNNNQVVVISGETGCGKSTQVPQIILDDAIRNKRSANTKILVTEPRRIAASSLAMRVAEERAESLGKSVGYGVRLERVECRQRGSIMFCTTGVLLVELEVNQSLSNYTHIIVDEVHERDCLIDISMCMLRQVLKKRKDLKLILMSATIDSESLSAYYDNCPMLHIKGLAFPVRDVYLEEILHMTRYRPPPPNTNNAPRKPEKPWMKHLKSRYHSASNEMAKEIQYRAQIGPWLESIKKSIDRDVYQTLQDPRIEDLDMNLIFQLLLCISRSDPGAILVFLPGIGDITKLIRLMQKSNQFPETLFDIHPLHSKLPTLTQRKIFMRPPGNIRKIIIATNIAETSITIDDIVYVVDCAKVKYKGLSVMEHVSTLNTEWASQSNLRQRRGRAGRCQPGICYHLVTSFRASQLEERLLPELLRDDLLEPVLQIKRLRLGMAEQALSMMPAVPHSKTICNAIRHLQQCGALDECETLTPLGWHLARLPVHPAAGKLLLLGALFGCLDRAASVAAVWGFKDPFNLVIGKERQVNEAKKYLALGEPSDHIAISEAIIQWENQQSYTDRNEFAREYFLSMSTLKLLSEMKNQFGDNLKQMGFLKSGNVKSIWENRNADNLALFKAIVAAALYPNIGSVRWQNLHVRRPNKQPYILVRTCDRFKVQVHPSSVMATRHDHGQKALPLCTNPGANWLVYWLKQRSTQLYLIEVTLVYTLPLLFFGELKVTQGNNSDECFIDINSIKVCCDKETTLLLFRLRSLLDQVLASKIMASGEGKRSSIFEEQVLNAVIRLITAEDARTEYLDDDDRRGSEVYNDGRAWN